MITESACCFPSNGQEKWFAGTLGLNGGRKREKKHLRLFDGSRLRSRSRLCPHGGSSKGGTAADAHLGAAPYNSSIVLPAVELHMSEAVLTSTQP